MDQLIKTNRAIVDRWQEIIDSKIFDELETVEADNVVNSNPSGTFVGIDGHKQMLATFALAFPDYLHENFNFIETGDWIAMEGNFTATHTGPLAMSGHQISPTNNKIDFPYAGFIRIDADGKVAENRLYYDSRIFLEQLGL